MFVVVITGILTMPPFKCIKNSFMIIYNIRNISLCHFSCVSN
jgi:hypothetical protein